MGTQRVVIDITRSRLEPDGPQSAWCSIHGMHPGDCFPIHYPLSSEAVRKQIR